MRKVFIFALFLFAFCSYAEQSYQNNSFLHSEEKICISMSELILKNPSIIVAKLSEVNCWKKIRPEETQGPWVCPKCGYTNPGKNVMCRNCAFPFDSEIDGF